MQMPMLEKMKILLFITLLLLASCMSTRSHEVVCDIGVSSKSWMSCVRRHEDACLVYIKDCTSETVFEYKVSPLSGKCVSKLVSTSTFPGDVFPGDGRNKNGSGEFTLSDRSKIKIGSTLTIQGIDGDFTVTNFMFSSDGMRCVIRLNTDRIFIAADARCENAIIFGGGFSEFYSCRVIDVDLTSDDHIGITTMKGGRSESVVYSYESYLWPSLKKEWGFSSNLIRSAAAINSSGDVVFVSAHEIEIARRNQGSRESRPGDVEPSGLVLKSQNISNLKISR